MISACPGIAVLWDGHFVHCGTVRFVCTPYNAIFFRVAIVHQVSALEVPDHLTFQCVLGARPGKRRARAESYLQKALRKREVLMWIPPFRSRRPWYPMKPSFMNLFIKALTRERVVPIIVARVPCDIPVNLCILR